MKPQSQLKPLVIIPARGGSKGIPGKNIKHLGGRPLISYTIDCAKSVVDTDRIILSTDSPEIERVAAECGLPAVYHRPEVLGSDTTGSREVILDVMDWADNNGMDYDVVVLLQPTSPFRIPEDVFNTLEAYTPEIDMAVTVCQSPANPYYNCFETMDDGFLHISKGDGRLTRRQDAPPAWIFNGAVYAINPRSIRTMTLGEMPRRKAVVMPESRSLDMDTMTDWFVGECLLSKKGNDE